MRGLLYRYGWALRRNNNVRLLTLWAITFLWLVVHVSAFDGGQPVETSELRQQFNNYHLHQRWETDAEIAGKIGKIKSFFGGAMGSARWVSARVLFVLILGSIIYFPIAMRDEVQLAWRTAVNRLRAREGVLTDVRDPAQSAGTRHATALSWGKYVSFEFFTDFLWELISHSIFQRR